MKTLEEVLEILEPRINRSTLEVYIARQWVRPHRKKKVWQFEEIDIARLELICHLAQDIEVNDEGMDIALSLLDQLYGLRAHVSRLTHAIAQQPQQVQSDIMTIINQLAKTEESS
jgi:chaperone modulatory protein CbpM